MKKLSIYSLGIALVLLSMLGLANCQTDSKSSNADDGAVNDASIVLQINDQISNEPLLKKEQIQVTSNYGNVTLSGLVDTNIQAEKAITLAHSNKWVKDVDTKNLKVKNSHTPLIDTYITAKIHGALIRDGLMDITSLKKDIKVETVNKVVYLSGNINTQPLADKIIASVKSVRGVSKIKNGMKVKQ